MTPMMPTRLKSQAPAGAGEAGAGQFAPRNLPRVRIDLGRRKQISLGASAPGCVYVVESGCLTLDVVLSDERRQVLLILYPGEMVSREVVPPLHQACLTAILPSVVSRMHLYNPVDRPVSGDQTPDGYACAIARLMARCSLHAVMIGRLTGEERLAALLVEMALFLGTATAGGYTFELPLTRDDMADYLALNPDTLSRMISRLKARHLISLPTRHRVIIKDFAALLAATPLAEALQRLHRGVDATA